LAGGGVRRAIKEGIVTFIASGVEIMNGVGEVIETQSLWMTRSLLFIALVLSGFGTSEPQQISVRALFSSQTQSLQRHIVTVEGIVRDVVTVPGSSIWGGSGCATYGRSTFMLEDETGLVPVEVIESCNQTADASPKNGESIRVTGSVHVLDSDLPRRVSIQATKIEALEDNRP
jgi:hypothetical protein